MKASRFIRTLRPYLTGAALSALALSASGCALRARGTCVNPELSALTVVGTGEARAAPNIARSSMGIEVRAETAAQATAQANERMRAVLAALQGAGVAESDLRTHDFSLSFEREYPPQPYPEGPVPNQGAGRASEPRGSYRVSNMVEVTIRDLARVSEVLGAGTTAGANQVWGLSFDLADREPLHAKAREQAITRAKQQAAQLAQLTGVKLGRIVSVLDQPGSGAGPIHPQAMRAEAAMSDGANVPVQAGELTVTHQVRLAYALD